MKARVDVPEEVSRVYAIVAKATGNIGGNGERLRRDRSERRSACVRIGVLASIAVMTLRPMKRRPLCS